MQSVVYDLPKEELPNDSDAHTKSDTAKEEK